MATERTYGGDLQQVPVGNIHTIQLPAVPAYRIDHTYQSGVLATSQSAGVYTRATGPSSLAQVSIQHQTNGGTSTLAESRVLFDALGRVWKEEERLPGGWSTRETLYDGMGQKIYVSEQGTLGEGTSFLEYDPFGRPRRIRQRPLRRVVDAAYKGVAEASEDDEIESAKELMKSLA